MRSYTWSEFAVMADGGALSAVVDRDIARPYVLNGGMLLTRKVTMLPERDSGRADYEYGPWREVRSAGAA